MNDKCLLMYETKMQARPSFGMLEVCELYKDNSQTE